MNADRVAIAADTPGWLHPGEGETLRRWALKSTGLLLELGTYCGKSTVWIGDAAEQTGRTVISVDWHHGSPEMDAGQACHDPDMLDRDGVHDTVPHLRRTLRRAGLEDTVIPIIGKSLQVGAWWSTPLGFAFIDASHDVDVREDYRWISRNMPAGVLCFHDSEIPAIVAATDEARQDGWVWAQTVGSLAVFTR